MRLIGSRAVATLVLALSLLAFAASPALAAPAIYHSGTVTLSPGYWLDLDTGSIVMYPDSDDLYSATLFGGAHKLQAYWGGAILKMGMTKPSFSKCSMAAVVTPKQYGFSKIPAGTWLCAKTNQGRVSRFKIVSQTSNHSLVIRFVTWA